jgi:hypothetical protein
LCCERGERKSERKKGEWRDLCFELFNRFERALTSGELGYLFPTELTKEVLPSCHLRMETDSDYGILFCLILDNKQSPKTR